MINELKEVKGDDTWSDLLTKIRKAVHVSPTMQANSARIDITSIAEVRELTEVLGKIFVDLLGPKIYVQRVKTTTETKVCRVGSAEKGNILSNYLDKKDYTVIINSKDKEGLKVQNKAVNFSGTSTIIGMRPAPVQDVDLPKEKKGSKKGNTKSETTPGNDKKRKRK